MTSQPSNKAAKFEPRSLNWVFGHRREWTYISSSCAVDCLGGDNASKEQVMEDTLEGHHDSHHDRNENNSSAASNQGSTNKRYIPNESVREAQSNSHSSRGTREKQNSAKHTSHTHAAHEKREKHSAKPQTSSSGSSQSTADARSARERVAYRQKLAAAKLVYSKKCGGVPINWLPDEIMLEIFSHFAPQDLLSCTRVCKRWHGLASDNLLWEVIYKGYAKKVMKASSKDKKVKKAEKKAETIPEKPGLAFWKKYCVHKGAEFRNTRALKIIQQKKLHPFTGLERGTQEAIQKSGLRWVLCFVDDDFHEHTIFHNDVFFFDMSMCIRWYNFDLPSIHRIKKLRIYSGNPIFFDEKGHALPNSPLQRSILYERDFKLSQMLSTAKPLASDDIINVYDLSDGLFITTWKDDKNLAFISMSFHCDNLAQRCLHGTTNRPWMPARHKPFKDDIDNKYGLHSYTCTLELRNMRTSFWSQQFMNLHCLDHFIDGYAVMQLIDPERSFERSWVDRKMYLPWKTEALKGIVQDVCLMDVTLLDDQRKPIWCSSGLTKLCSAKDTPHVTYEYDGDYSTITYTDHPCGKVICILIWEESSKKFYMTSLQLHLSLQLINSWFSRRY